MIVGNGVGLSFSESNLTARLTLEDGRVVEADAAVLTPGNLPPYDLPPFAGLEAPVYIRDPWSCEIAEDLGGQHQVLLIGSGLTAIDCALTLRSRGFSGRILTLSHRGLIPHSHSDAGHHAPVRVRPSETGAALVRMMRQRARLVGWRNAVDELRPFTQNIWRAADDEARRRFLRHLRPYWDVHRHRLAPDVRERIDAMQANGSFLTLASKIVDAQANTEGIAISWRPRGQRNTKTIMAQRAINSTGPLGDLTRTRDPLLQQLCDAALIRPASFAIGVDVDREGHAINAQGELSKRLCQGKCT